MGWGVSGGLLGVPSEAQAGVWGEEGTEGMRVRAGGRGDVGCTRRGPTLCHSEI